MPKQKTRSGVKKRFKVTANGQVKYAKPQKGHLQTKKSPARKRKLRKGSYIQGKQAQNIKKMING